MIDQKSVSYKKIVRHQGVLENIVVIQRIFPEYRKPIFDAIFRKIRFTLLHSRNTSGIKQTSAVYSHKVPVWRYGRGETQLFFRVFGYIWKHRPQVIIHELAIGILSLPVLMLLKRVFGYKVILWGHMYNHKIGFNPQRNHSDKYRLWLQKKADAIITYSAGEKAVLIKNHIDGNKIFPALNTLDTNRFLPFRDSLDKMGKSHAKSKMGFVHQFNLIFIGRLYDDKWPEDAIRVLDLLVKQYSLSIALHFVGTGSMEKFLVEYANQNALREHVFFHSEIYDEQTTGALLFASDMMIMPGCVGLSVNHAFCFDCPVITFESVDHLPAHGPEIEYIVHGETGFVVRNRNVQAMAETIHNYLADDRLKNEMKIHIRNMIENICPIDKLTTRFIGAINYVEKKEE